MAANQANVALLTQDPGLVPQTVTVLAGGGPSSQRPANPAQWFHYYDTDLNREAVWNGAVWIISNGGPTGPQGPQGPQGPAALFGPTAMRPTNPAPFQRYFDTDINAEIWWERGAWRTVAGTVGDIKVVQAASQAAALANNPGWIVDNSQPFTQQTYLFKPEDVQQIISATGPSGQWFSYDLTANLAAIGLQGASAVIVMIKAQMGFSGFGPPASFDVIMTVATDIQASSIVTPISAQAVAARDDSATSAADKTLAMIPLNPANSNNIYYSLRWSNSVSPAGAVWLSGVVFNPTVHPLAITDFAIRKT